MRYFPSAPIATATRIPERVADSLGPACWTRSLTLWNATAPLSSSSPPAPSLRPPGLGVSGLLLLPFSLDMTPSPPRNVHSALPVHGESPETASAPRKLRNSTAIAPQAELDVRRRGHSARRALPVLHGTCDEQRRRRVCVFPSLPRRRGALADSGFVFCFWRCAFACACAAWRGGIGTPCNPFHLLLMRLSPLARAPWHL